MLWVLPLLSLVFAQRGPSYANDEIDPNASYLTVISLLPGGNDSAIEADRRPFPPRPRDRCPKWGDWEKVKCWWPDQAMDSLPSSCTVVPTKSRWPDYMKKFVEAKAIEKYNMIVDEYKRRGSPAKCGFCSRSFECRSRNSTESRDDRREFCPLKEIRPIHESCNDSQACEVSQERGGCPPPMFLGNKRIEKLKEIIKKGDHKKFASELFKMKMMDEGSQQSGRTKRQAGFDMSEDEPYMAFDDRYEDSAYMGRGRDEEPFGPPGRGGGRGPGGRDEEPFGPPGRGGRRGPGGRDEEESAFNREPFMDSDDESSSRSRRNSSRDYMQFANFDFTFRDNQENSGSVEQGEQFLGELLQGTSCATTGDKCLCCCGHYIPNVETGACEDLYRMLPGIGDMMNKFVRQSIAAPSQNQQQSGRPLNGAPRQGRNQPMQKLAKSGMLNNF